MKLFSDNYISEYWNQFMEPAIPLMKERLIMQLKHSYYSKPLELGKDCLFLGEYSKREW